MSTTTGTLVYCNGGHLSTTPWSGPRHCGARQGVLKVTPLGFETHYPPEAPRCQFPIYPVTYEPALAAFQLGGLPAVKEIWRMMEEKDKR